MAENAAHISTVPQPKPTVFEVLAQDSLMNTIRPALKVVCDLLTARFPETFSGLSNHFEEGFLGFNFVVQYNYLNAFKASFSEAFYGLQRLPADRDSGKLPRRERALSLAFLVLLPYVRSKLQSLARRFADEIYGTTEYSRETRAKLWFVGGLKTVNSGYECLRLYYLLRYLGGLSGRHCPLLAWAGVELAYREAESSADPWLSTRLLARLLETLAFFVQFLNWWHSGDLRLKLASLPVPPPPPLTSSLDPSVCPVCNKRRKVEVALQTSGYVFCYRCIRSWLETNKKCPVTDLPATMNDLIRMYPSGRGS